ncbi:DUF309 domain-containing protein [Halobacillus yeomjeoni]|uniref:DUF309 domain-containing protein n=1 Tax=Halobacillus yeomjeoni TaxID=311194 RepID=UPI001CD2B814|nr:DUF309 domain-containing protein [Halobacillus yeomjeoni]MCA0982965.1 DUF309 domain-containing protein [Halobacillus yeomjeoni]
MYPTLYIQYLAHFHGTRDYFECHEVLEELWKDIDPKNRNSVWVLLIQLAVCLYHYRRGNVKGAGILIERCQKKLSFNTKKLSTLGLSPNLLNQKIKLIQNRINDNLPYESVNLPITDRELEAEVIQLCKKWNVTYGKPSSLDNEWLLHKHRLRHKGTD